MMEGRMHRLVGMALAALLIVIAPVAQAAEAAFAMGSAQLSLVDASRSIKPSAGFEGAQQRRIDVLVWYPAAQASTVERVPLAKGGPWPLVIYSHGTFSRPDSAMHLVRELVGRGYVVAAPNYPLTSSTAFTKVTSANTTDVIEQTRDIGFVIDSLLTDPFFKAAIDPAKIGTTGISLGAVTSYFASFGAQTRDPRIKATAPIAAADPVQSALQSSVGMEGTQHAPVSVPVLFVSGDEDIFAKTTGRPYSAFMRLESPKFEVMIKGAPHLWFGDGAEQPADGKNPDCVFFERAIPGRTMAGCGAETALIDPHREKLITRTAVADFFDAYLNMDAVALARLRGIGETFPEVTLLREE
jgi:predicted dienelactone hydrolase